MFSPAAFVLTLTGAPSPPPSYPYTGGTVVWPYSYAGSSGQLTLSQNGVQRRWAVQQGKAIVNAGSVIYVLDNEPVTITPLQWDLHRRRPSQILPLYCGLGRHVAGRGERRDSR